jgi:hypothetical protein
MVPLEYRNSHQGIVRYFAVPHAASGRTVKRPGDRKIFRAQTIWGSKWGNGEGADIGYESQILVIGHFSFFIFHFSFFRFSTVQMKNEK